MSDDASLRTALRHARDAFQFMSDGVVFADANGTVVFANTSACHLTGAVDGTLEGSDGVALLAAAEELGLEVRKVARASDAGKDEGWIAIIRRLAADDRDTSAVEQRPIANADVLELAANLRLGATLDDTIAALCTSVAELPGFDGCMILLLPSSGDLIYKAHAGRARVSYKKDQRIALKDAETIIDMTLAGPWAVSTNSASAWRLFGPFALGMRVAGIRATAYAGLRAGGRLLGVLSVASMTRDGLAVLEARLETLAQVAGLAATMISNQNSEFGRDESKREQVRQCIDQLRFHTVFQPIVSLSDGSVHAFEALTRFDDGGAPDAHFRDAHAVGLGRELEEAAARVALDSRAGLPEHASVALNFSPEVLVALAGSPLLQAASVPLVVEITEHVRVEDYRQLRTALAAVPHIPLSVDDAGAGFASLRHILELQPEFVKLDIALVRDVHLDPARAALVAGMCHFARSTGKVLIAEGVECVEEAQALRQLGVELAQGFYFARPAPAEDFVRP